MKVGDLVRYNPTGSTTAKLYEEWGHKRNFKTGLIIEKQRGKYKVTTAEKVYAWYIQDELEVMNES